MCRLHNYTDLVCHDAVMNFYYSYISQVLRRAIDVLIKVYPALGNNMPLFIRSIASVSAYRLIYCVCFCLSFVPMYTSRVNGPRNNCTTTLNFAFMPIQSHFRNYMATPTKSTVLAYRLNLLNYCL